MKAYTLVELQLPEFTQGKHGTLTSSLGEAGVVLLGIILMTIGSLIVFELYKVRLSARRRLTADTDGATW